MNYRKYTYESDFESQKAVCKSHASSSRQRCRLPMMQISHIFISPHGTGRHRQIEYIYARVTTWSEMFWVSARVRWLNFIPRQCTHYINQNWATADNAIFFNNLLKSSEFYKLLLKRTITSKILTFGVCCAIAFYI